MNKIESDIVFTAHQLRAFTRKVFEYFGVPSEDSALAADVLAYSDEHGIDSHGVARLKTYYDLLKGGRINPRPVLKIIREKKSIATVDGDNGLGLVIGPKCMRLAMEKAKLHGSGWISVCNTNHYGAAGYYPVMALPNDLIGLSMTNTTKGVAPFFGMEKMLGTNPIAIAFPGFEEPPVVIDFATSTAAYGKVEIAKRKGLKVPTGWCLDKDGLSTNNPEDMMAGGALLPLGSNEDGSGHKGYCLASMVDILTAVLSGANWGPFVPPFAIHIPVVDKQVGKGIGHFFGALDIEGFRDTMEFKLSMDDWIRTMRKTKPQPGYQQVLIPGDPERIAYQQRMKLGIPLNIEVVNSLTAIANETGIDLETS
jgi:LDH2 family malate/lactate/ureidoglycolate dehydrogenase